MIELLRRFARPYTRYFVAGPLTKLVEVGFDLCTPLVIALMIDRGVATRSVGTLLRYGALLALMACAGFVFTLVCQKMAARASQGIGTSVRDALFSHVMALSSAELDRFGTPSLITRITNDVNQVQLAVALAIRQLVRFPLIAVGSMIAALLIDVKLGLIFLVSTPVISLIFWLVMAKSVPFFKRMQGQLDTIARIVREGLGGARVVRAFVREEHERGRLRKAAGEQAQTAIGVGMLSSVLNPATFLVMNLAVCAILWTGGVQVQVGDLTQGEVMAFVNYMTQALLAIVYVANLVVVFTRASASAGRIVEVLDCVPSIVDAPVAAGALQSHAPALRMDHVSFAYPGAAGNALSDVSLELEEGGALGIIGGTGSGKSSLVNLIIRLYDVTSGGVEVFGRDVRTWPLRELRRAVGFVPQKAELVSGTIKTNLSWRNPSASDAELWRALEAAQAAEFVRALPQGLDAPVEAGGKNFSGGQRQRLTIARALVGSPRMLVLDDSASALDFKTDAELRRAVRRLGITTVTVSQRVASVRDANVICVLRHGVAVGLGTHDELVESCEVYREICASQLKGEDFALTPQDEEVRHA
ncbi:MAG: ABC transporter ATP-binding protein [Coriobacteriaceae bacterium]|nr:ABC transporter ATP-binding protein [Coriobacteriaceae bacterium]